MWVSIARRGCLSWRGGMESLMRAIADRDPIRQGLTSYYEATGSAIWRPCFLAVLAEGYGQMGATDEGLRVLTEALAAVQQTGERVWEAELDSHGARDPVAPRPRRDEPLNTPEKMVGLFCATRFEPMKVWVERFEHHWELDELSRMHLTFGRTKRKLESLDASTRAEFLVGVRQRLQGLAPEAFIYRAAVVCGVACRPA